MRHRLFVSTCVLLFIFNCSVGLEFNRQQIYNTNTDFLLHEGSGLPKEPKRDYASSQPINAQNTQQPSGKRDYVAQFPPLGPPKSGTASTSTVHSATTPKPHISSGKRDYVAPQFPTPKPQGNYSPSPGTTNKPQTPGAKRDYVAPQFPAHDHNQQSPANVKDLINFYDNMNKGQNPPQKTPSYSSILQGSTKLPVATTAATKFTQSVAHTTPKPSFTPTLKPLSFSSIVAGSNKPGTRTTFTPTVTSKPASQYVPSSRPGSPVLPSTIVNNNKNINQVNANGPTDIDLQVLSEELLRKDVNNAAKYITVNYQEKTTSQSKEDKAPEPMITVSPEVWNIPTVQKFVPLLDNYERDTLVNEYVTPQERNEENAFMDAIMSTTVIRHLMNFLKDKGYVTADPRQQRDFLKQMWFGLYSRGKGKISSSGFEHIFVSELKNGEVSGLHNWIYFHKEEMANRVNYLGYLKYVQLNDKGVVMKIHFNQQGVDKPVDSLFVGTSPELEMALYTLCFVARPDNDCNLKLGNKDVSIITHTFRYRSKNHIGSAFPQI